MEVLQNSSSGDLSPSPAIQDVIKTTLDAPQSSANVVDSASAGKSSSSKSSTDTYLGSGASSEPAKMEVLQKSSSGGLSSSPGIQDVIKTTLDSPQSSG